MARVQSSVRDVAKRITPAPVMRARQRVLERRAVASARPFVALAAAWAGGVAGKRVLEVGADQLGRNLRAAVELGAAEAVGVNPAMAATTFGPSAHLLREDAGHLPFDDGHFDVVITDSTFEHVHDLPGVLAELHRVTGPGGTMLAHYGPIWSAPYGHHLWVEHGGRAWTYWDVVLPSWCHLLDEPEAVARFCTGQLGHDVRLTDAIVRWVFEDEGQNRLLFDDYAKITGASPWHVEWFKGYDTELAPRYRAQHDVRERHDELQRWWPDRDGWLFDGITMVVTA